MNVLFNKDGKWIIPHLNHTAKNYYYCSDLPVSIVDKNHDVVVSQPNNEHIRSFSDDHMQGIQEKIDKTSCNGVNSTYSFVYKDYFTFLIAPIFNQTVYRGFMIAGPIFLTEHEKEKANAHIRSSTREKEQMNKLFELTLVKSGPRVFYLSQLMNHMLESSMHVGRHTAEIMMSIVSKPEIIRINSKKPFMNLMGIKELLLNRKYENALKVYKKFLLVDEFISQNTLQAHNQLKADLISLLSLIYEALLEKKYTSRYLDYYKQDFTDRIMNSNTINTLYAQGECMIIKFGKLVVKDCGEYSRIVKMTLDYIHDHYQEKITIQNLCETFFVSRAYLSSVFKKEVGDTIMAYINGYRVQQSQFWLENTTSSVLEIALECGFDNANYFSNVFKKITGLTPRDYRKFKIRDNNHIPKWQFR